MEDSSFSRFRMLISRKRWNKRRIMLISWESNCSRRNTWRWLRRKKRTWNKSLIEKCKLTRWRWTSRNTWGRTKSRTTKIWFRLRRWSCSDRGDRGSQNSSSTTMLATITRSQTPLSTTLTIHTFWRKSRTRPLGEVNWIFQWIEIMYEWLILIDF